MVFRDQGNSGGHWSNSHSKASHPGLKLGSQSHTQKEGAVVMSGFAEEERLAQDQHQWNIVNGE
ncbi:uncharacterized protein ACLA_053170 [Aspergillus clavatus NRRL 1]|uniref:Uncharacterized protein n=1 Tax=Aspergillus clavatus (strain ATCC 1007 / CBS 513.65 / DSM 816 / NCTC 3887 / NRRL 1 / QM 1276 / 107) TaxID=344612 RepID=A1CIY8_ASPCL|nr:uncharacterized protein ACLA_053170 [Aspergillus clavatus NRRL 1]EAW10843.1 hypothetical protein ACLA_053170 [Aspergillus clavatus NRRL 1]